MFRKADATTPAAACNASVCVCQKYVAHMLGSAKHLRGNGFGVSSVMLSLAILT